MPHCSRPMLRGNCDAMPGGTLYPHCSGQYFTHCQRQWGIIDHVKMGAVQTQIIQSNVTRSIHYQNLPYKAGNKQTAVNEYLFKLLEFHPY